jgi:hypothetical protein
MKPKIFLWAAITFIIIHLIGHTIGHFTWTDSQGDPLREEVVRRMTEYKFDFMGANRSMGDYYEGYSALLLIKYLVFVLLLWAISGFADHQPQTARKLLAPISLGLVAFGILEFVYFFPFAASMSMAAGLCTFASMFGLKKT